MFLVLLMTLALVMPRVYSAGPMDEQPSNSSPEPDYSHYPPLFMPHRDWKPLSIDECEKQMEAARQALKNCKLAPDGIFVSINKDDKLVFSSDLRQHTGTDLPIIVNSLVQKNLEDRVKNMQRGLLSGYGSGAGQALTGLTPHAVSPYNEDYVEKGYNEAWVVGYHEGYAAGLLQKNLKGAPSK